MKHTHTSHPAIVKRLKRAHGHLASVIAMIESERPCLELAQQLHAVENALANAKTELIHDHIDHCLNLAADSSARKARTTLAEFKALAKYL
jgi:DNA-binding FrmR family transcriptional regulator